MPFKCKDGCGQCCGVVHFSPEHYRRVHKRSGIDHIVRRGRIERTGERVLTPLGPDGRCAFLDRVTMACKIHDDQPQVCQEFGLSDDIEKACPHVKPDGTHRKRQDRRRIFRETPNPMLYEIGRAA